MFKALDRVHYDTLELNKKPEPPPKRFQVKSLADQCCMTLNWYCDELNDGMHFLPVHLVPKLLRIAIANDQAWGITTIIANWPMEVLRFADILSEEILEESYMFDEDNTGYFYILEGLTGRTEHCKLKVLDFTGLQLSRWFCKQIVQSWPFLSLKNSELNAKKLARTIATASILDRATIKEFIPELLDQRIKRENIKTSAKIKIPRGQKLEIKIDDAHFSTDQIFLIDYLITYCLRSITPLYITFTNIHITSQFNVADVMSDHVVPFAVLRTQDIKTLKGISLQQLEEGALPAISSDVMKFTCLQTLDIQDCNLYLKEGITRSRTATRSQMCKMLGAFNHLRRLDISFNFLTGCLGELLDSLQQPLEFLSIRGCDVCENDLIDLATSKHAPHIRELNLSKLCCLSLNGYDHVSPKYVVQAAGYFPRLTILNISQNNLPDSGTAEFCEVLNHRLPILKVLDISGNIMQFENQILIAKACTQITTMQLIRLTCISSSMNEGLFLDNQEAGSMCKRLKDVMKSKGREDIDIDIVRWSVAILVDLIDFFD